MRLLFIAYCMINNENGDSLIGVYKRSLRIGLELAARGHEVWVHCAGRHLFRDDLTTQAEQSMRFLDLSRRALLNPPPIDTRRRYYRRILRRLASDVVVIGEVPLAGSLLEIAQGAIGLGQRVVVLDNAYSPGIARNFLEAHGPFADGVVLTGLSTCHPPDPPPFYCAVPPYVADGPERDRALPKELAVNGRRMVVVLSYERKAEQLAISLLPWVSASGCCTVFVSAEDEGVDDRLRALDPEMRRHVHVVRRPSEGTLFALIRRASLMIGKCGFMQVSEALALGVPFIGVHYRGCFSPDLLDARVSQFVHATHDVRADEETVSAAMRFLHSDRSVIGRLHDGQFGAARLTADFIEGLGATGPRDTTEETARLGYGHELVFQALQALHPSRRIEYMGCIRGNRLRQTLGATLDNVTCVYEVDGIRRQAFFWGRHYPSPRFGRRMRLGSARGELPRTLAWSKNRLSSLEPDRGEGHLPRLEF